MFKNFFSDPNARYLKKLEPIVMEINQLEKKFESFSDDELRNMTDEFRKRIKTDAVLDNILPEAFAVVREAAKRTISERPYDVQLMAGIVLHRGEITEMKTGEGKTLAAVMPVYLNALKSNGVHLVTVNDYLSKRDAEWMGHIYSFLGMSVGCLQHEGAFRYNVKCQMSNVKKEEKEIKPIEMGDDVDSALVQSSRHEAYNCDIIYGTNNEFGFDYLRDNMAQNAKQVAQRNLDYAIIDEVDSVLIDEARTPLIISAPDMESTKLYQQFTRIVPQLQKNKDYEIDEKQKAVTLTEKGMEQIEKILGTDIYQANGVKYVHQLEQALRAHALFKRDINYVVKNGQVLIVDEFTGRLMPGRRYSGGLHQAIEAKERVVVQQESRTLASITFQNYFRLYNKLSGMTGTAATSAEEFHKVYNLDVVIIPTNKPMIRKDLPDAIFKSENGKFKAVLHEVQKRYKKAQPVLVGTIAIEKSEKLSRMFKMQGIEHQVLNAKFHEQEAKIIAKAGEKKAVTIATNMAGRGTDIKLGQGVVALGGLHIIGTERHEARRIDNQLRGRSGRQGDPGSSQSFVSLEDDLMRVFASDRIKGIMTTLKFPEDQPIENKIISRAIESAQGRIEGYNFDLRHHVLEYDDVMNKQRETIYKKRRKVLFDGNMEEQEKMIRLRVIDLLWMEHLDSMDHLRDSVRLRAYAQQDPLIEYKKEGFRMFEQLLELIEVNTREALKRLGSAVATAGAMADQASLRQQVVAQPSGAGRVGRNDPCGCGSGKKYKKCCLNK